MEQKYGSDHRDHGDPKASKDYYAAPPLDDSKGTPNKKRRKVNHACVYCRRSHMTCDLERPCTRCIKRNIGHLCHDEPRDAEHKKPKTALGTSGMDDSEAQSKSDMASASLDQAGSSMGPPSFDGRMDADLGQAAKAAFNAGALGRGNTMPPVQPAPVSGIQGNPMGNSMNQFSDFSDAWLTTQNQFQDMHNYHPNYMLAPEVTNEFNLLNDFLHSSMLDDGAGLSDDQLLRNNQPDMLQGYVNDSSNNNLLLPQGSTPGASMPPPTSDPNNALSRPKSALSAKEEKEKAREYYLQAADPSGNDTPEERMQRVLKAKFDAGLLKPFNYIKGYQRLSNYLDSHIAPASKQKILRQLDRFRPKFREKMQTLTNMDLVFVEMWFEKTLLEYDRVFASMAIPACCWRRTGEIFRGNKEMAELIHVPVERLRDGQISLHEILTEESVVRYWEEFGTIAFDPSHDTLLTATALKNPDDKSTYPIVKCCFSLKIRRDDHKIPSLIVGNFLPHEPPE